MRFTNYNIIEMGAEQIKQQQLLQQQQMLYQQQQAGMYPQKQGTQQQQYNVPQISKQQRMEIQGEKTAQKLNNHMQKIDDMIARKTYDAELKQAKIKELIVQGKKAQAKQMVGELKQLKTNIQNFQTRRKVLAGQVNTIQMATVDASMAHTMSKANEYMKANETVNEKINDILLDQKQIQAQMAETNHLMNQMAQSQINEDEDDLFKELEMQVAREKAAVINQQMHKQQPVPAVSVVQPSYVQPQQHQQMYAPMGVSGGQQYVTKNSGSTTTGLTSQYQPQTQYNQQIPQTQYKPKAVNHMDQITRMLNG